MQLENASNEHEFISSIRNIFTAYVPESNAWAKPNFFDINATVIGGLFWSATNEIRNGIDTRLNPQTASGAYLDMLVAQPPLNLSRLPATHAKGLVKVKLEDTDTVKKGDIFKSSDGIKYKAIETVTLENGEGVVEVISITTGEKTNAQKDRPLQVKKGKAHSLGIFGGFDVECDEQLRRRYFTAKSEPHNFGSACNIQDMLTSFRGVTRSWAIQDGLEIKLLVLMEDKYPCGIPQKSDFDEMRAYFDEPCRSPMFFCPIISAPKVKTIMPEISWQNGRPNDMCEVTQNMQTWLRHNFDLGEGVRGVDIQNFLDDNYGEYAPKIDGCCDYPAGCDVIYNCVEIISC